MMRIGMAAMLLAVSGMCQAAIRSFAVPEAEVKTALHELGAYDDAQLPMLEGFVAGEADQLSLYERPHYQFHVGTHAAGAQNTSVEVTARITAWRGEYRSLASNGRLEADLLDRLDAHLRVAAVLPADVTALKKQVRRAEQERRELADEIRGLQEVEAKPDRNTKLALVIKPAAAAFERPGAGERIVFRAELQDELEIVEERGAWVRVSTGTGQSAWMRRADLNLSSEPSEQAKDFEVMREEVREFSGDWPELQGKPAAFLWVRAKGESWAIAKRLFAERYLAAKHQPQGIRPAPAGAVVVIQAAEPAIAAASMTQIRSWVEGEISEAVFARRCSLDPVTAFHKPER